MLSFDVIVCGCGCAGLCAAIAAARNGMKTAIIEKYAMPGDILTVLGNNSIDQFNNPFRNENKMVIGGIGWDFVKRLARDGFARVPDMNAPYRQHDQYSVKVNPVAAAKVMDDMLLEAGVTLFYSQPVVDVSVSDDRIQEIIIATKEGLFSLTADIYIDCTGDGDLAHLAGATTDDGDGDGHFQPGTLRYYPAVNASAEDMVLNYGDNLNHVSMNTISSDALTKAEIEGRRLLYNQMRSGKQIMSCAPAVAPREGRRIRGITQMVVDDYISGKQYPDSVCYTFWFVDIHRDGAPAEIHYVKHDRTPSVRLSAMISSEISNLMMAGRCISTDRATNSAIRVKASCMAMGEAVGTAAALAIRENCSVSEIAVDKLKQTLAEQGAIVPGICDGKSFII
jgi:hypothetical protein